MLVVPTARALGDTAFMSAVHLQHAGRQKAAIHWHHEAHADCIRPSPAPAAALIAPRLWNFLAGGLARECRGGPGGVSLGAT